LIRWENGSSKVDALDADKIGEVRSALNEVGVRLSEVFGADHIIWVEGETERLCFPLVAKSAGIEWPSGISMVAILNTGDFEGKKKDADLIWKLYERLSSSNALLPAALSFSFDRENRSARKIEDVRKRSGGIVKFLARKMYENYLINPKAIAVVIAEFSGEQIELGQIKDWLVQHGGEDRHEASEDWNQDIFRVEWLRNVHGGKLLKHLFEEVTGTRLYYDKVVHSSRLTEWLLENDPHHLCELVEYVRSLLIPPT
jgi:hypothetical protein